MRKFWRKKRTKMRLSTRHFWRTFCHKIGQNLRLSTETPVRQNSKTRRDRGHGPNYFREIFDPFLPPSSSRTPYNLNAFFRATKCHRKWTFFRLAIFCFFMTNWANMYGGEKVTDTIKINGAFRERANLCLQT